LCVDLVCDLCKILRTVLEVHVVGFDYKDLAFIIGNPFLVSVVQIAEVFDADALFIVSSALLDL
jgi:hypothetical protein